MPWFVSANEVNCGYFGAETFVGGSVSVSKRGYALFLSRKTEKRGRTYV